MQATIFHFSNQNESTDLPGTVVMRGGRMTIDLPDGPPTSYGPYLIHGEPVETISRAGVWRGGRAVRASHGSKMGARRLESICRNVDRRSRGLPVFVSVREKLTADCPFSEGVVSLIA